MFNANREEERILGLLDEVVMIVNLLLGITARTLIIDGVAMAKTFDLRFFKNKINSKAF